MIQAAEKKSPKNEAQQSWIRPGEPSVHWVNRTNIVEDMTISHKRIYSFRSLQSELYLSIAIVIENMYSKLHAHAHGLRTSKLPYDWADHGFTCDNKVWDKAGFSLIRYCSAPQIDTQWCEWLRINLAENEVVPRVSADYKYGWHPPRPRHAQNKNAYKNKALLVRRSVARSERGTQKHTTQASDIVNSLTNRFRRRNVHSRSSRREYRGRNACPNA